MPITNIDRPILTSTEYDLPGGSLQFVRRFRIPAIFCALAVLVCELIGRPFVEMGISDDGPYILMAQTLATTGHVVYNGWPAAMLGCQLYLGAAFIKLFGFSYSSVRMSTLLIATALAFVLQRTLVRTKISERNATIGTLALVLSPLYLMLSVTFMTDIIGLFAVILCLYGCLRALQAYTSSATIGWLCFAVVTNAVLGTSRQIAWLGILLMLPCTIWLLRSKRNVALAGIAATIAGTIFIFWSMTWFSRQPYTQPEHLLAPTFNIVRALQELFHFLLEIPFLLLPIFTLFVFEIRKTRPRYIVVALVGLLAYALLAFHLGHHLMLEPTMRGPGDWVGLQGIHEGHHLQGNPPLFLHMPAQILLSVASFGGLFGLMASLLRPHWKPTTAISSIQFSWRHVGVLLVPFAIAYTLLLMPRATTGWFFDRYALELLVVTLFLLVRYYQEQVQPRLGTFSIILVVIMAIYGIAVIHNQFSLYRARVMLRNELYAAGIPDTAIDGGFESNFIVELQHSNHINDDRLAIPADAYIPTPPLPAGTCEMFWYDKTPHIRPLYGISFDANACYGPAPFAPIHYSRWLASAPGVLYVVRYTAPAKL